MSELIYEDFVCYIFDREYLDFVRLHKITSCEVYFVIRTKATMKFNQIYSSKIDKTKGVLCDQIGKLSGFHTTKNCYNKLRLIKC